MFLPRCCRMIIPALVGLLTVLEVPVLGNDGAVRLTYTTADERYPDWSPDGSQIVFESDRSGNWDLYVMWSAGGAATQITADTCYDARASWSPDGSQIAFESDRSLGGGLAAYPVCDLFVVPATGGSVTQITTWYGYDERPDWSPDGTQLVFAADRPADLSALWSPGEDPLHPANLWSIPVTGEPASQLTTHTGYENDPVWSPDGTQIAFRADYAGHVDIWVMPATGGTATQVTDDPASDEMPSWSPSGNYIAFESLRSGVSDIWVVEATGGTPTRMTSDLYWDYGPSWSPDGSRIAFFSNRCGNYEIYTIAVENAGVLPQESTTWSRIKAEFSSE
jgi:Tol biopolymer transport system component